MLTGPPGPARFAVHEIVSAAKKTGGNSGGERKKKIATERDITEAKPIDESLNLSRQAGSEQVHEAAVGG